MDHTQRVEYGSCVYELVIDIVIGTCVGMVCMALLGGGGGSVLQLWPPSFNGPWHSSNNNNSIIVSTALCCAIFLALSMAVVILRRCFSPCRPTATASVPSAIGSWNEGGGGSSSSSGRRCSGKSSKGAAAAALAKTSTTSTSTCSSSSSSSFSSASSFLRSTSTSISQPPPPQLSTLLAYLRGVVYRIVGGIYLGINAFVNGVASSWWLVRGGTGGGGEVHPKDCHHFITPTTTTTTDDDGYNDVQRELLAKRKRMQRSSDATKDENIKGRCSSDNLSNTNEEEEEEQVEDNDEEDDDYLRVTASPGLTTLLDDALYHAYEAELQPTVSSASRLLCDLLEMKEASALVLRECRWAVGVPLCERGLMIRTLDHNVQQQGRGKRMERLRCSTMVAECEGVLGDEGVCIVGGGAIVDGDGVPVVHSSSSGEEYDKYKNINNDGDEDEDEDELSTTEAEHIKDISSWNEYDTIQDFAMQCYLLSQEAIHRLTTDRLADSANRTVRDTLLATTTAISEGRKGGGGDEKTPMVNTTTSTGVAMSGSSTQQDDVVTGGSGGGSDYCTLPFSSQSIPSLLSVQQQSQPHYHHQLLSSVSTPGDVGIGRCYDTQSRLDCWESPRLYCPDYCWAEDMSGGCHRLLRTLSKHRFLTLVSAAHGWDRYIGYGAGGRRWGSTTTKDRQRRRVRKSGRSTTTTTINTTIVMHPPTYASNDPHAFPSLEAVHSLQYLVLDLLSSAIPCHLNQFRAAVESNAVVSKRLYLVKCEYRAPLRALWESCNNLNAAPKIELVERYLRDYHSTSSEGGGGVGGGEGGGGGGGSACGGGGKGLGSGSRKKGGSSSMEVAKKTPIQQQREKLEIITEKYWRHPAFVEALKLEQYCEQLEGDMSRMLLPLANLASEIMCEWKGRVRAVAIINETEQESDDNSASSSASVDDLMTVVLGWQDVPFMRELLRRLKSILRRKPELYESTGIRPLLLDLQGVPRHKQDLTDSSIEMPFYNSRISHGEDCSDQWFYVQKFTFEVDRLIGLLTIPNIPFLVEERLAGGNGDKNTLLELLRQCTEVWDKEMFKAQFMDWFDMVRRQQELNANLAKPSTVDASVKEDAVSPTTLSDLSEVIRGAEIELSIAMASKDQLERVHQRLEALRADKAARYKVLAQIVFDVGYRELNNGILIDYPTDNAAIEFPYLSVLGVFGEQLTLSGEVLPIG